MRGGRSLVTLVRQIASSVGGGRYGGQVRHMGSFNPAVFVDKSTRAICQGITGKNGTFHTERAIGYATNMVRGVTPKKGGTEHLGLPVFNSAAEAKAETRAIKIMFRTFPSSDVGRVHPSRLSVRELSTCRVFIVAGESSGDAIGSRLMASLRCLSTQPLEFAGVGGPLMESEGLKSQFPMEDISVMGLVELIPHSLRLWMRLRETIAAAIKFQPNVVITIDSKGFSFRVLRGIADAYAGKGWCRPLAVHYVAPSFWAWKGGEGKLRNLSKILDHILCILPFEEAVCQANGIGATFVGHPVLEDASNVTAV